jgi:glutamate dehydrogenase/leucine dehydrogenase
MTISARPPLRPSLALADDDHERIVIRQDPSTGLRFIVAVHSTVLGPALGGLRLKRYPGGLTEALADVMGLARTMTLKASAAGLSLGGGKAVMLDDGLADTRNARLIQAAGVIHELDGAYITAEDIGTSTADMDLMSRHTPYVVGRSVERGGGGDPSPVTAETVFQAIRRGLGAATGSDEPGDRRVGVVGLGKVGYALTARLAGAGADVVACDLDEARAERCAAEHGIRVAPSAEAVLAMELDVIAPCAAGGMIDDALGRAMDCRVVAGAANNPLTNREVARTLARRGILYVPDFLANCGGLIHVASEWYGQDGPDEGDLVERAMECLERAIATADAEDSTPVDVAERQALQRVASART